MISTISPRRAVLAFLFLGLALPPLPGLAGGPGKTIPLAFEPNRGQTDARARFLGRGAGYTVFLTERGALLDLGKGGEGKRTVLRLSPEGGAKRPALAAEGELRGKVNYYAGNDPKRWHTGLPTFSRVRYRAVYPGVDLVFQGGEPGLGYAFELAPGAPPAKIRLAIEGVRALAVEESGDLRADLPGGALRFAKPSAYQEEGGRRIAVESRYVMRGGRVGFAVGDYDESRPLFIE